MTRAVLAHRAAAALWAALAIPAALWWREAVWFVIAASVWANVYAAIAAAEAADDRRVLDRLDQLAELLGDHFTSGGSVSAHLGATVLYRLTDQDAEAVNARRADARAHAALAPSGLASAGNYGRTGHVAHVGNDVRAGEQYPATVVRVWPAPAASVNLQVHLDGTDVLWSTSVTEGAGERQYSIPAGLATGAHNAGGKQYH